MVACGLRRRLFVAAILSSWISLGVRGESEFAAGLEIDFSHCGFRESSEAIPLVPATVLVTPSGGDDTAAIQGAIDAVALKPVDADGFRGTVALEEGVFTISKGLEISQSGIVLRGRGMGVTRLMGTSPDREPMIRVFGEAREAGRASLHRILGEATPMGARTLRIAHAGEIQIGSTILVTRPSTQTWIEALGMDRDRISWKPGTRDLSWERRVLEVDGDALVLDFGLTMALDARFGGGTVSALEWTGRLRNVGIESLTLDAVGIGGGPRNEDRPWFGVTVDNARDIWVRQVAFEKFSGSAVALWETASRVTVRDCLSLDPRSEIGGERRRAFFTAGSQSLFLRCWSEGGIHDFGVGHAVVGPIAFVECVAHETNGDSGALGSWATGVLFDNVVIDGGALRLDHRWTANSGTGWSAANCVVWQTQAAVLSMFDPPGAANVGVGVWARLIGDSRFEKSDEFVRPRSLFIGQLERRLGPDHPARTSMGPVGREYPGATNPSVDEAASFVEQSSAAARTLKERIWNAGDREPLWRPSTFVPPIVTQPTEAPPRENTESALRSLTVRNGELFVGDEKLRGSHFVPIWWRGVTRPQEAASFGPAITRFVPGRYGLGYTDSLPEVARWAAETGVAVFEHHHGLWYDRRRDDHLRVRRADGDVLAPFYEMPFRRSGEGKAWDGLSLYNLREYNPWYWRRLRGFADHCEREGLVLLNQHYFQHNILEAGAHWADFPWRSANNINQTGFPEPPPYIGDKRIFQAHLFYDTGHPIRNELHRAYIRKNLNAFKGQANVLHSVGAEFTGPASFVAFWLDTIMDWEDETGEDVLVCLSCPKDVQDTILSDPRRRAGVSVIDIRYWGYTDSGTLYAPPGGRHLSPRQFARQSKANTTSEESRRRAVAEYRERYPEKAVLFDGAPWP